MCWCLGIHTRSCTCVRSALEKLGLSVGMLATIVLGAAVTLLLVFVFIFLGIGALTTGTSFGAVVNSVLPLVAGGAVGAGGGDESTEAGEGGEGGEDEAESGFGKAVRSALESIAPKE